ncbi:rhodanese-related sulfurtransferase [Rhodoligotrophos ferricapiens]|uniref:oxygen-dependent tRNA uridine(34) hydroxylase TrhO n=1 Tax=Rhodoligotrophos ferricapiens TaxID=3069264 RepID=UPI00315D91D5
MTYKVVALYQFVPLPEYRALQAPLRALAEAHGLKGTLLLASEGLNGTLAGEDQEVDTFIAALRALPDFQESPSTLELRLSRATAMPFKRLKVRLKSEIVRLGVPADPLKQVGTYVAPRDWNRLLDDPEVVLVDTRNHFEVELGTFPGAIDPSTRSFGEFPQAVRRLLDPARHKKVAMFCTGGIRCEKATAYLLSQGFSEVYHLKGGILSYLEQVPEQESRWRGACFVFDERGAVGQGLTEIPLDTARAEDHSHE